MRLGVVGWRAPARSTSSLRRAVPVAEIVVKSRIPAVSQNGLANALDPDLGTPELMLDEAEQMQGMGMTGVDHKNVTANPLRLY